jgi:hypothetical protein
MKYTVVWLPPALNRLADIWNRAGDRQAVSRAATGSTNSSDPTRRSRVVRFTGGGSLLSRP